MTGGMRHIIEMHTVELSSCERVYDFWSDGVVEKAVTRDKRIVYYATRQRDRSGFGKNEHTFYSRRR